MLADISSLGSCYDLSGFTIVEHFLCSEEIAVLRRVIFHSTAEDLRVHSVATLR